MKSYDFDPRRLIKTYDDPDREKIQYEGLDILKRYLPAPEYAHPIMGDFSQIVFELNAQNEKERAFELIDYLKQFTVGAIKEFGDQVLSYGKGQVVGAAIGSGLVQVMGYCAPLSVIASKLAFPYMIASGVYGIYRNWEAFKADLEGCKDAILAGRTYDAGRHAVRAGLDVISAGLGCRIMSNTLAVAYKKGLIDDATKAMKKGGRDTDSIDIAEEVQKKGRTPEGLAKLCDEFLCDPAVPIDKAVLIKQVKVLNHAPTLYDPSSPLIRIFQGAKSPRVKGFFYEMLVATNQKHRGEDIQELGKIREALGFKREFDIITRTKGIECKTWDWQYYSIEKFSRAFIEQKMIADAHKIKYEVHSQKKITDNWKELFLAQGITFFEESEG